MIEADVVQYLRTTLAFTNVHVIQAPKAATMPYVIVEVTGGSRKPLGIRTQEHTLFRVSVDCGPSQMVTGRTLIGRCLSALENYRGQLQSAGDVHIVCSAIRGWAGLSETYRFMFDCEAKFMENRNVVPAV
jgi:hypothetical protein